MRRVSIASLLVSALALSATPAADADGGNSIASAPAVVIGQQEFGTLASRDANCVYASWWLLPVVVGDMVQIDWEVQDGGVHLHLWSPGTNDFNYSTRESLRSEPNPNLKTEFTFQATQTGNMPMRLAVGERCSSATVPGPYSFTVYLTHALSIGLPHIGVLRKSGTISVAVHNPEGGPINDSAVQVELQIKGRGAWQRIGGATVANSAAAVAFKVPPGLRHSRHVTLRALAHGTGYSPASTAHLKVRTL